MLAPRVNRSGSIVVTPNGWVEWHPLPQREPRPLPAEWAFRAWGALDVDSDSELLAVLDRHGMIWGDLDRVRDDETTPAEFAYPRLPDKDTPEVAVHLAVVREHLVTLRGLARMATVGSMPDTFWHLLDKGLAPFTPVVVLGDDSPVVDLYQAGCWQVFSALSAGLEPRQCANPACRTMFYRKDGTSRRTADARYCSERCRSRAADRRFRERNRARLTPVD